MPLAVHCGQGPDLNGITQRRARSVRFNVTHLAGFHSGILQSLAQDGLLRRPIGHGQSPARPVLVHG